MAFRMARQVRGVALIVPGGRPSSDPARLPAHVVPSGDRALLDDMTDEEARRFAEVYAVHRRDIVDKARRSIFPAKALWDPGQVARVNRAFDFSFDAEERGSSFDGPSLIVDGRQDRMSGYLDAMDLAAPLSRSTTAVLDRAGHGLAWERPDLFNAMVGDWLERRGAGFEK